MTTYAYRLFERSHRMIAGLVAGLVVGLVAHAAWYAAALASGALGGDAAGLSVLMMVVTGVAGAFGVAGGLAVGLLGWLGRRALDGRRNSVVLACVGALACNVGAIACVGGSVTDPSMVAGLCVPGLAAATAVAALAPQVLSDLSVR